MREILFRGKRIDNGKWVYGFYFCMHHDDDREHLHHFIIPLNVPLPKDKPIGEIQVEVDPSTIGQYTGLTDKNDKNDKNGKKIFEGDIVRTKFGRLCKIRFFVSSYFCGVDLFPLEIEHRPPTEYDMYRKDFLEVVGNIHDNPELLEDKP